MQAALLEHAPEWVMVMGAFVVIVWIPARRALHDHKRNTSSGNLAPELVRPAEVREDVRELAARLDGVQAHSVETRKEIRGIRDDLRRHMDREENNQREAQAELRRLGEAIESLIQREAP